MGRPVLRRQHWGDFSVLGDGEANGNGSAMHRYRASAGAVGVGSGWGRNDTRRLLSIVWLHNRSL